MTGWIAALVLAAIAGGLWGRRADGVKKRAQGDASNAPRHRSAPERREAPVRFGPWDRPGRVPRPWRPLRARRHLSPPVIPAPPAIARERAGGCVESAVRASCGADSVRRLYLLRDRWAAAEADLAIERARREEEGAAADRALELQRAIGREREATARRELAECRAVDRPAQVPWWVWPAVGLAGATAGAAAWEAVR